MKQKDDVSLELGKAAKAVRTAVRLKHSIAADEEINRVLPEIERQISEAAANGKAFKLNLSGLFE